MDATLSFGNMMVGAANAKPKQAVRKFFTPKKTTLEFNQKSFAMAHIARINDEMNKAIAGIKSAAKVYDAPGMHSHAFAAIIALRKLMSNGIASQIPAVSSISTKIAAKATDEIRKIINNSNIISMNPWLSKQFIKLNENIKLAQQMRMEQLHAMRLGANSVYH